MDVFCAGVIWTRGTSTGELWGWSEGNLKLSLLVCWESPKAALSDLTESLEPLPCRWGAVSGWSFISRAWLGGVVWRAPSRVTPLRVGDVRRVPLSSRNPGRLERLVRGGFARTEWLSSEAD